MDALNRLIDGFLTLLSGLLGLVLDVLAAFEGWLRGRLEAMHLDPQTQTVVLVLAAILFLILAVRLLSGLIRVLLVLGLLLLLLQLLRPLLGYG